MGEVPISCLPKLYCSGVKVADRLTTHSRPHFFKYVTYEGALRILKDIAIKWSSPLTFNDPFGILVKPNIGFSEDEFKKYSEKTSDGSLKHFVKRKTIPFAFHVFFCEGLHATHKIQTPDYKNSSLFSCPAY